MKAIITQETTIVNFDNIVNVIIYSANTFKTKYELRALDTAKGYYTLASYETRKDALAVFYIVAQWLETEDPVLDLNFPEQEYEYEQPEGEVAADIETTEIEE
ncbi:MAG: hypothetical protein LBM93_15430 [Oscillospiraceae bacterium]|jgi:hypothetical protein|nr:hypothetical protein [Oscillospiraceae bacterium]